MKTNFRLYLLMMVLPLILFSCGGRGKRGGQEGTDTTKMAMTDTTRAGAARDTSMRGGAMQEEGDFIKDAASGGMMEVELGRYAEKSAQNPRVKKFGAMMVRDHSKANDELKSIVTKKNMQFMPAMDDKTHDKMTDVMKKQGADFDKDYMDLMVDDHQKDVDRFKKEAEKNEDPDLKAWAAKTLPTLLMHLDSAKAIQGSLKR
jgi:putative membrane protein